MLLNFIKVNNIQNLVEDYILLYQGSLGLFLQLSSDF